MLHIACVEGSGPIYREDMRFLCLLIFSINFRSEPSGWTVFFNSLGLTLVQDVYIYITLH